MIEIVLATTCFGIAILIWGYHKTQLRIEALEKRINYLEWPDGDVDK